MVMPNTAIRVRSNEEAAEVVAKRSVSLSIEARARATPVSTNPRDMTVALAAAFQKASESALAHRPTNSNSNATNATIGAAVCKRRPIPVRGIAVPASVVRKNPPTSNAVSNNLPRVLVYSSVPTMKATMATAAIKDSRIPAVWV